VTTKVCLPLKTVGLSLPNPVANLQTHLRASEVTNSHLIQVMRGAAVTTQQAKTNLKEQRDRVNKEPIATIEASMPTDLSQLDFSSPFTNGWNRTLGGRVL
jgi:hypothetical protein